MSFHLYVTTGCNNGTFLSVWIIIFGGGQVTSVKFGTPCGSHYFRAEVRRLDVAGSFLACEVSLVARFLSRGA